MLLTHLIGVKSEKEPLTGTSPVKWLFERSLHCKAMAISNPQEQDNPDNIQD